MNWTWDQNVCKALLEFSGKLVMRRTKFHVLVDNGAVYSLWVGEDKEFVQQERQNSGTFILLFDITSVSYKLISVQTSSPD
jgi:hypothetical protein